MEPINFVIASVIGGIILFVWTGFAQNVLPWGVKSVAEHKQGDGVGKALAGIATSGMVYVKDEVAAFVAIKPESYYSVRRYFGIEILTQIGAAVVLTGILALTAGQDDGQRLMIVGLAGLAGVVSIDVQYWNWWGFSNRYTVGVAINRLIGYVLTAVILLNWVV